MTGEARWNTRSRAVVTGLSVFSVVLAASVSQSARAGDESKPATPPGEVQLIAGYGWYGMAQFDQRLGAEGNKRIRGGRYLGAELVTGTLIIDKIPVLKIPGQTLPMLGFEYLAASSRTTHADTLGSATVSWDLPVAGVYFAPEFRFAKNPAWFDLRPIGIGWYWIGLIGKANLTISDRPGSLDASGSAFGLTSQARVTLRGKGSSLSLILGYRWLEFTDVALTPRNGFTIVSGGTLAQPGNLPNSLEYSGPILGAALTFTL